MDDQSVAFMRDLEQRYRAESGLPNRAHFKIFYGLVRPAPILVLGINPGGHPDNTSADGARHLTGEVAAASAGFYEGDECDLLDCNWKENIGLRKALLPLFDGDEVALRKGVVKTNIAFRRSHNVRGIDIAMAKAEARPFLAEIVAVVRPKLVILTSVDLDEFLDSLSERHWDRTGAIRDPGVKQIVFQSAMAQLSGCEKSTCVVRIAHASQFSWTYTRAYEGITTIDRVRRAFRSANSLA